MLRPLIDNAALLQLFVDALSNVALVLGFRALPFAAYLICRPKNPKGKTAIVLLLYVMLMAVLGDHSRAIVLCSAAGLAYYALVVCVLHWAGRETTALRPTDGALLLGALLVMFLLVPATLLRPLAFGTFQVLGWDLTLKGYSYTAERGGRRTTLSSCLFFFLVDPSIVFVQRATRVTGDDPISTAVTRIMLGLLCMLSFFLAFAPLVDVSSSWAHEATVGWTLPLILISGFVQLIAAYSMHSGLASLQLGLLRLCGYVAPERYNFPLLAKSPGEFWSRWNMYVGQWVKRYLYMPLALQLARRFRPKTAADGAPKWTTGFAVFVVFMGVGVFHDVYTWCEQQRFTLAMTAFFVVNAVFLVLWTIVARRLVAPRARFQMQFAAALRAVGIRSPLAEQVMFCAGFALIIGAFW